MTWQGDGPPVLGIDLGGTKILGGVVGSDHRILGRAKRTTPAREGGPAILEAMVSCVDEALRNAGMARQDIAAAGIGSPGPLDTKSGVILFSANLNVRNYPIGPELAAALDRPSWCRTTCGSAATPSSGWVPAGVTATSSRRSSAPGSAAA